MKFLILLWPFLCATSENKNRRMESVAITHALISCYVSWGVITGLWNLPTRWDIHHTSLVLQVAGWLLWAIGIFCAMTVCVDTSDEDDRFHFLSIARYPARHRQLSYIFCFFGIWLIAYTGGYFKIPLGISALSAFAFQTCDR